LYAGQAPCAGWDPAPLGALLEARVDTTGRTVAVLSRGDYQIMLMQRPPVPAAELARSVRWAVASQVDFAVDDAVIVNMAVPTPSGLASAPAAETAASDLYVVAAQARSILAAAQAFKAARHTLDAVDVRETAQRNMAALLEQGDECLCLLRVTQLGAQLTFTHRGELYLDRFIAQPRAALQAAEAFEKSRIVERMAQQAQLSIAHIKERHPQMAVNRVVLCPLPSSLDMQAPLQQHLSLPVEALDLADVLDLTAAPQLASAETQARYFTALGAALRGRV